MRQALPLILCLIASSANAERGYNAHDGDTFRATFRIANVDSPEIDGKCEAERRFDLQAKEIYSGVAG